MGIPLLENKKVQGFPYLKIEVLPNSHFKIFDRYEIHIQAFVHFVYGQFIIFRSSSSQNYFQLINSFLYKNYLETETTNPNKKKHGTYDIQNVDCFESQIDKKHIFPG